METVQTSTKHSRHLEKITDMDFSAALMQVGPIPPPQGPLRDKYMDEKGRESLASTRELYGRAIKILSRSGYIAFPKENYFSLLPPPYGEEDAYGQALQNSQKEWERTLANSSEADKQSAGELASQSLKHAVNALNYLEDHPGRDTAHLWVHRAGALRAATIGCPLTIENGKVWRACPVNIVHIRVGMSPGFTTRQVCSICKKSAAVCEHFPGDHYTVIAEKDTSGQCNICDFATCTHEPGESYLVEASYEWGIGRIQEFSFVRRPRQPLARLVSITEDFTPGSEMHQGALDGKLHCTACLMPCPGFTKPFDDDLLHSASTPIDSPFPTETLDSPDHSA